MKEQFYSYIQNLQDQIVAGLEAVDGQANSAKIFGIVRKVEGKNRVIENGAVFEKGGVSAVHGNCRQHAKAI
jgi:coproporphyrinogen III oxidase